MKDPKRALVGACALMCAALFPLSACSGGGNSVHTHTFSEVWSADASSHWHEATCGHPDEKNDFGAHTFENGVCSVCGYKDEKAHVHTFSDEWSFDRAGHWHEATCGDTNTVLNYAAHTFENGVCSVCGYEQIDPPEEEEPPEVQDEPENAEIFGGTYTKVTSFEELSKIQAYLQSTLLKVGAGGGFKKGDLSYTLENDVARQKIIIEGLEGDIHSSENLKVERMLCDPALVEKQYVHNLYADGNAAIEERGEKAFIIGIKDAAKNFARNEISLIYSAFSPIDAAFQEGGLVQYKMEGGTLVISLDYMTEESFDLEDTHYTFREETTLSFAFENEKIIALKSVSSYKTETSGAPALASYPDTTSTETVYIGNYPVEIPNDFIFEPMEQVPVWASCPALPDASIFARPRTRVGSEGEESEFLLHLGACRGNPSPLNYNFKVTKSDGNNTSETIFNLHNGEGARIKQTASGKTLYTDEKTCIVIDGQEERTEESKLDALYGEFLTLQGELLTHLNDYKNDAGYKVEFVREGDFYLFCIIGPSGRETSYVYSAISNSLCAVRDIKDGVETTLIYGDYTFAMPKI